MKSMCAGKEEASNLYLGSPASYTDDECDEITLSEGDCINDLTTFYLNGFVGGFGYNTTKSNSGIVTPFKSSGYRTWALMESYFDSIRSPMGNARIGAGNDTSTQTCLTSFGIAEYTPSSSSSFSGGIVNVELYYNEEIPTKDS